MKTIRYKSIVLMISMVLAGSGCFGVENNIPDQQLFVQANDCYTKGEYVKAYEQYLKISDKIPAVHYNLGNCAFKLGKYGYALLYWRRAERNWGLFGREELNKNIEVVKKKLAGDADKAGSEVSAAAQIVSFFKSLKNTFISTVKAVSLLHLQLFVLIVWLMLFFYLRYLYKRKQRVIIVVLFILQALSASMLAVKYSFQFKTYGVVVATPAPLMSGPGKTFSTLQQLSEGQETAILKESGDFYKIRVNTTIGWIDKQVVEKV